MWTVIWLNPKMSPPPQGTPSIYSRVLTAAAKWANSPASTPRKNSAPTTSSPATNATTNTSSPKPEPPPPKPQLDEPHSGLFPALEYRRDYPKYWVEEC